MPLLIFLGLAVSASAFAQSGVGGGYGQAPPCTDSLLVNCRDSVQQTNSGDSAAYGGQGQIQGSTGGSPSPKMQEGNNQVYIDQAGTQNNLQPDRSARYTLNRIFPPDPPTDFQRLAKSSIGEMLPVFGRNLFESVPSTFAPGDQIAVTPDYVVGPGDDVLLRFWGPETFNSQLTVDRSGSIYIPKVGAIHVAGLRFDQLQQQITNDVSHTYRNFHLSVNLGRLRSIQVYVVGEARRPGAYTVSSLSTVLNALFVSGGPNVQGSMRRVQIRREGATFPDFDLYDLVLRGDKSRDRRLENGDTIFIPAVGPQIALGGAVRHPAIYEVKPESTVEEVLNLAGGLSATASPMRFTLDRIEGNLTRRAMNVTLDAAGRSTVLRDGDVLYANHIMASYEHSVTLRGNLANPGRFAWHEGMRLSEIIPDRRSLLTNEYWRERNRLGVPVPLFEPLDPNSRSYGRTGTGSNRDRKSSGTSSGRRGSYDPTGIYDQSSQTDGYQEAELAAGEGGNLTQDEVLLPPVISRRSNGTQDNSSGDNDPSQANENAMQSPGALSQQEQRQGQLQIGTDLSPRAKNRIQIPAAEINWSYAVIERLDPATLKTSLVPFNLGRLVQDGDATQNLELHAGDVVTILSQNDVLVAKDAQTKYVRLEGEFAASGVYSVGPDETLDDVVRRAGGLTAKAYLYGSSFQRESARAFQQQRLDEYISTLSADMERSAAVRVASSASGIADPNALAEQRSLVAQLRQLRATGRIVLEFKPGDVGVNSIPKIPLENGDVFRLPSQPNTVSVIGSVYGQNVFLYNSDRKLQDYVALAGNPNRIADRKHAFIIRADGSIYSRERAQGVLSNNFESARINPGDAIVLPEKLVKPTALRNLIDYSQVLSSFGLAAAALNVIR